jgi:hypothetical protein
VWLDAERSIGVPPSSLLHLTEVGVQFPLSLGQKYLVRDPCPFVLPHVCRGGNSQACLLRHLDNDAAYRVLSGVHLSAGQGPLCLATVPDDQDVALGVQDEGGGPGGKVPLGVMGIHFPSLR